jgi:phosphoribosyl 1,2-cyclic phosphodiesterase
VEAGSTRVLVDAGLGARELAERVQDCGVDPASLAGVLLSHEHGDHLGGAASFSKKWGVPLYGSRGTYAAAGLGAYDIARYEVLQPSVPRTLGDLVVLGVAIPHDAAGPLGFVIAGDGVTLGHATDLGTLSRAVVDAFRDCDGLLVESNYDADLLRDGPYPWSLKMRILGPHGHLANSDVARYLATSLGLACRTVVLGHLSETNNHPEVARMAAEAALRRAGRTEVALHLTGADGTGWFDLLAAEPRPDTSPRQLRLF